MGKRLLIIGLVCIFAAAGCATTPPARTVEPEPSLDLETLRARIDAGDYEGIPQALEALIAEDDTNAEAYFLLGLAYFNNNNYEEARQAFERALDLDPQRAAAVHHNLGALAYQIGELETAEQEFQAALEADPNDSDSHYQLGATYLVMALPANSFVPDQEKVALAKAEFEQALEITPGKPEALVGMGNVYLLQNQVDEAITTLEEAVNQNPAMPEALFALGRTYAISGQSEEARAMLERFLETDPPEIWAQQAEDMLSQLGQ